MFVALVLAWISAAIHRWTRARRSRRIGQPSRGRSMVDVEPMEGAGARFPWSDASVRIELDRVRFGPSGRQIVGAALWTLAGVFAALVVDRATSHRPASAGAWCASGLLAAYSVACVRVRVVVGPEGISSVPRLGRRRQIRWGDVSRLGLERRTPPVSLHLVPLRIAVGVVELCSGEVVDLPGFRAVWWEGGSELDGQNPVIAKLRKALEWRPDPLTIGSAGRAHGSDPPRR